MLKLISLPARAAATTATTATTTAAATATTTAATTASTITNDRRGRNLLRKRNHNISRKLKSLSRNLVPTKKFVFFEKIFF